MRNILFVFVLLSSINIFSQKVRFDGVYQTKSKDGYRAYIRFYADKTVLTMNSAGVASEIQKWFNKDFTKGGKYEIDRNKIYFSISDTKQHPGTIIYEGKITSKNRLELNITSLINGYESKEIYYFVKN